MEQRQQVCGQQLLTQTAEGEVGVEEKNKIHSDANSPGFRIRPSRVVFVPH